METGASFVLVLVIIQFVEARFSIAATSVISLAFICRLYHRPVCAHFYYQVPLSAMLQSLECIVILLKQKEKEMN